MAIDNEARLAKQEARKAKKFTKAEKGWMMYDWANSIYATNISAAIFPIWFTMAATAVHQETIADVWYGYAVSAANLVVAILAPILGAIGDYKGMKKKLWGIFLAIGLVFTFTMAIFDDWKLMLIGLVISRIGFSGSCLFNDAFLTDVTTEDRMDRVSAYGFALGYFGGSTLPFVISIAVIFMSTMDTFVNLYNGMLPELAATISLEHLAYKFSILLVVIWWGIFSIPFMKHVKQQHSLDEVPKNLLGSAFANMWHTLKEIFKNKKILFFILAYFFYIDGVDTIINLATKFGSTLGLDSIGMILALVVTQVVAIPFSILFGNLGKKHGAIKLISIAVGVYFVITFIGAAMGYVIDFYEKIGISQEQALSVGNVLFWILATLVGTVQGGIQALSRSYFGQIIPPERSNEYYGFLDIFGKFSCVIGPALYAFVLSQTGYASYGILSIVILFLFAAIFLFCGRKYFKEDKVEA